MPGDVAITVLATADSPQSSAGLVERARLALSAEDVRPLTDRPRVSAGLPLPFRVLASLAIASGPDATLVLQEARIRLDAVIAVTRRLGAQLSRSALYAALHVPGVVSVDLQQPVADIRCNARQFPACEGVVLSKGAS
jgi:phage-related baseplate assembly protein